MKPPKKIPTFKDENAEREFWANADSTEYIDWSQAQKVVLPNFRPTLRTISLRLPESMIAELKLLANQRDVPYQSLLKVFLAERLQEERTSNAGDRPSASRKRAS
jgi:predicted DNA binding CopG/RHH family protein